VGSLATPLIAIRIVKMRIIVVARKRNMDMCFWSIIFPNLPAFIKVLTIYRLLIETQAQYSRHHHVINRKQQITKLGRP
jgi:hypothetical protein